MSRIIFDIETAGTDFEALDPATQEYLLKWADSEEDKGRVRESLSFHPVTAEIITIGMLNPDTNRGVVWFQSPNGPVPPFEENGIKYECGDERDLIGKFWTTVKAYDQFVTFNGRTFDCPFIMVRSAVHGITPTRNLMPNRYSGPHIDLLDQLTFFGATRRFNLDMWCRTFSIRSPKESGITGYQVKDLFRSGRSADIARYCAGDLEATKELLLVWEKYIRFPPQGTAGD